MSKKKSHYGKAGLVFEELEPRLLLSADPLAAAVDAGAAIVQEQKLEIAEDSVAIAHNSNDQSLSGMRNELVFIDARAPNYQQLYNDLIKVQQQGRTIHIVVLDAHRDGIEQINAALANHHDLDAVHIISHGDGGQLQLGTTVLDKTVLQARWADVSQWKQGFTDGGDLLIYGCNLANTTEGKYLVDTLGYLTETDVAASDDLTGHRLLGGDWDLEYEAGDIETEVAFSQQVKNDWQGTLDAGAQAAAEQQQAEEQRAEEQQQQQKEQQAHAEQEAQQAAILEEEQATTQQDPEEEQNALTQQQRHEIVIIDESVTNFQAFIDALQAGSDASTRLEIVVLAANSDGVERTNEILSAYNDVDALHIISHGDDGAVKLGDTWLNTANLEQYSDTLASWGHALQQNADILIYGCELAETANGKAFINDLAQFTGADVAASDDLTGHSTLGGDWDLEYVRGSVETSVALDASAQAAYQGVLNTFVVSNTNATGAGSLHQAILDANANSGVTDTITFNIAGAGPHVISLSGALPVITDTIVIDGTTEPDFTYAGDGSPRPVVVLDGAAAGLAEGIVLGAGSGGSEIRGLVIQNFQNDGILVQSGNNLIAGNILGLQSDGVTIAGNNVVGAGLHGNIRIESANNSVGGLTPAERNIISGSGFSGVVLFGAGATGNQIRGNFIGTDISGTLARGNNQEGIEIQDASGNTIGGTAAGARNIISANGSDGMEIDNGDNNIIQGNYIGTDVTGTVLLGNVRDGIDINENVGDGATGNLIGGTDPRAANLIAGNGMYGIEVRDAPTINNTILGNSIYNNGLIGIQLTTDGVVTLNDAGDADADSNNQQNFPVLTSADTNTVGTIVIDGTLNSTANSDFRIEFFASSAADGSGYGEGETYLGHVNVDTDGSGNASFSASLSAAVANGAVISATATRSDATYTTFTDTSEFAANINAAANFSAGATDDPQAYSANLTSLGPTGYWRLGEGAGVTAVDASGLNDGIYNSVTLGEAGAIAADGDTALLFDGIDDYVEFAHDPAYLLDDGSVQFWFKTTDVNQRADLFSKDALGNVTGGHLSIYLDGSGNIETRLQSATADYFVNSTAPLSNNQWHHVAFTFGAGGMQLYIDGQLQDSDAYTGGLGTTSGGSGNFEPIAIGASTQVSNTGSATPLQDYFSGAMDEVALFANALSPDQILNLYAAGLQNYTVAEDNTLSVSAVEGVLINDYDQEGDTLTAMLVTGPSNAASFMLYNDGSFDYTPAANFSGTDTFTYSAHDGTSDSNVATVTITVTAENDAPVNAVPGTQTVLEDTPTAIPGISVADLDAGVGIITTQLGVSNGVLDVALAGTATISAGANSSNTLTLSGSVADINATLVSLQYTGNLNVNGTAADTLTVVTNDQGNMGSGGAQSDTDSVQIDISPVNDAPVARDDRIGLAFDGVDDYVTIGDYPGLNVSTNLTMEAWVKPTGFGSGTKIIVNKEGEYEMAINATNGHVMWAFDNLDPDWNWHYTGYSVQADEWTHLAVTYDNGVVNTYANGVLVDTYNGSGSIGDNYPGFNQLMIGGRENATTQRFDGQIDEVRIWNTTRTQLDIQTTMGTLLNGAEPGLIGNWRFDEGSGITVQDQSSFGHHGTLADGINAAEMPAWQGYVVSEDGTLNVAAVNGVLANDVDIDGDLLSASLVSGPANAAAFTLNPDGSFDYTPTAGFTGMDSFSYRANDGSLDSNIATVTIRVDPVNDLPIATANTVTTSEDTAYNFSAADFTYTDVEGDALVSAQITNLSLAGGTLTHSGGTVVINGTTLSAAQLDTLVYTPAPNANGSPLATFDFTVNDADAGVVAAQMSINVSAQPDPALIGGAATGSVTEDDDPDLNNLIEVSGALTIIDPDAGEAAFNAGVFGGTYGVVTLAANGDWDYAANNSQPAIQGLAAGATLTDTITISSVDGTTRDIVITIVGTNDAPVAGNDIASVNEGGSVVIDLAASDSDIDNALDLNSIVITSLPVNGSVVVNGDGTVTYTHNGSETASDSFSYTIADVSGAVSNTASVAVTVNPINDAPMAVNDSTTVLEGDSVLIDLAANDSDADSSLDLNSIVITAAPTNGSLVVNGDGTVTYTHDGSNTTTDSFSYTIADTAGATSNTATVNIGITPVNDAPTTSGIADVNVIEDAADTVVDLNASFDDADNTDAEMTYAIVGNTNIGLFSSTGINAATGQLTLAYAADMNGSAQITIRASDPAGQSVDTLFTVSVSPVNDDPVLQTNAGKLLTGTEPTTISRAELRTTDIDNADTELVYTLTVLPSNGELLLNGEVMSVNDSFTQADLDNNLLVYRPVSLVAADGFGFTVSDGAGGSLSANTFNIFVQLTQSDDDVAVDESPPLEEQQNEDIDQNTAADDNTVSSITDNAAYGSSFEPFGQASAPPPAPTPPAPTPALSIDPAPPPKPPTQAEPVEAAPEIVTEIEDYQVSTFAAVQVKSMQAMWSAIDKMKQDMADVAEKQTSAIEIRVAAAETTGVVLTAGVVAWILRSGALLSSLISSIPLWKGYDPLPILAYNDDEHQKNKEAFDENKIPTSMDDLKKLKEVMKQKEQTTNEIDVDSMFDDSAIRE